jgi:hypothetical protein
MRYYKNLKALHDRKGFIIILVRHQGLEPRTQ